MLFRKRHEEFERLKESTLNIARCVSHEFGTPISITKDDSKHFELCIDTRETQFDEYKDKIDCYVSSYKLFEKGTDTKGKYYEIRLNTEGYNGITLSVVPI